MNRIRRMFRADWSDALFIHFRVDPGLLGRIVPFEIDTCCGDAYVSLVAFTQRRLRPAIGGKLAAPLEPRRWRSTNSLTCVPTCA